MPRSSIKPKSKVTDLIFLLDESGSMVPTATDVRGGFNSYVKNLKGDGNIYRMTAIKFGSHVRPLFTNLPLEEVPELTLENYMPLDSTALYDAIGYALDEAKKQSGTEKKPYGTNPVICIIMTDGFENASRRYNKDTIVERIKKRTEAGNWTFVYLGADQDAWNAASGLGLPQGNVLSYSSAHTNTVFHRLAGTTSATATNTSSSTRSFFNPTE